MPFSRSLSVIHFECSSVYMSTPNSLTILHDTPPMWNLKGNDTNGLTYKRETNRRIDFEDEPWLPGAWGGEDRAGEEISAFIRC